MAIVCGSRDYADQDRVKRVLDAAVVRMGLWCVIQGEATGADALAREWAIQRPDISLISVPSDWDRLGDSAGPVRNLLMAKILMGHKPDGSIAVIAFPGGKGTRNMCQIARNHDIRVIEA